MAFVRVPPDRQVARMSRDEAARLTLLQSYAMLDTPVASSFEYLVARAARLFATPMAALTILDHERLRLKAAYGLPVCDLRCSAALCARIIRSGDVLVIEDTTHDAGLADVPLAVGREPIRFYAGAPLISVRGMRVGTFCVLDRMPRKLPADGIELLIRLAGEAVTRIEVRHALAAMAQTLVLDHPR